MVNQGDSVQIFWDENIKILGKKDPVRHHQVANHVPRDVGSIVPTETVPTFQFRHPGKRYSYAYNPQDPIKEIQDSLPVLKSENDLKATICIFIGMGLGYSQLMALEQRQDIFRIIILEPCLDLFCEALKYVDLRPLFNSDKVFILAGDGYVHALK